MSNAPSIMTGERFSDRDLIEAIIGSYFILDYGFVQRVNDDKTINVTHATKPLSLNGESQEEITTENIEVLTLASAELSLSFPVSSGDKVLLLGLKNPIASVDDVSQAEDAISRLHYSRETLKAMPLCVFNADAKVTVEVEDGNLTVTTKGDISVKIGTNATLEGNVKVTGGTFECGGSVAPTGSGALCGLPFCAFTGAPQTGNISSGT